MIVVSICFLFVFLLRDAQLFSAEPSRTSWRRIALYWAGLSCSVFAAQGLNAAHPAEIIAVLRTPWVWGVSMGLHVAGLALCLWLRRIRRADWVWMAGLFPSPMRTLLLVGAVGAMAPDLAGGTKVLMTGLVILTVCVMGNLAASIGGSDSEFAVDFAAASNSTALAFLPLGPFF